MRLERTRDAASRRRLPVAALLLSGDQAANCCLKLQIRGHHWQVCLLQHCCECVTRPSRCAESQALSEMDC